MDATPTTSTRGPSHRSARGRSTSLLRSVLLVLLAFLLTGGSAVAFLYQNLQGNIQSHNVESYFDPTERPTTPPPADAAAGRPLNILVLGSDAREGKSDVDGAGAAGEITGMRSDTAMLMHISANRDRVDVVSIPRDTLLTIPSCILSDGSRSTERSDAMFNSAFEIGGRTGDVAGAAACTIRTVEALSGIYVDGFIAINFASFQDIVTTLGGVEVCLSEPVSDTSAGLDLAAGCQTLNGKDALALARARKSLGDGSDISRIGRQQQIVEAIVSKALSLNYISDLPKLYGVLNDVTSNVDMSSSLGNISYLGGLAYSLRGLSVQDLHLITMPFVQAGNRVRPAPEAESVWEAIRTDKPLPRLEKRPSTKSPILQGTKEEIEAFRRAIGAGLSGEVK
ncbi:LCP family protein [Trueperella pecoris]|uniref:LCP family protein n=1 Tax=Trueperella pecoris TaxID=2733571 RepID=A0A7M1QVN5_9ACTO|nr:LCP family protein [Trueperella pecoris]QOQ38297.1 LCP family protein [Trueperella pecoris]QOR45217.1 LCP family protein [Trueperella pecoris]QTG75121.1 LCP family protein [Trueperella pecoris]